MFQILWITMASTSYEILIHLSPLILPNLKEEWTELVSISLGVISGALLYIRDDFKAVNDNSVLQVLSILNLFILFSLTNSWF